LDNPVWSKVCTKFISNNLCNGAGRKPDKQNRRETQYYNILLTLNENLMKQIIGTIILLVAMQQVFGQECVQCVGVSITGTSASAIGTNTVASGNSAFASGFASEATYNYTTAIGFYSFATQTKAVSIGSMVKATFDRAMVIGSGGEYGSDNYLVNSRPRSLMIGFNSINPTLYVSESPTNVNFDNTGSVGIGNVTAPQAKLHIRADAGEPATLRLEATGTSGDNVFSRMLFTPNHSIQAADNQNFTFSTQSTKHFVFQNGNVGIGTNDPSSVLHIHQSEEPVLKLSNDQGNLIMAVVNTPWDYAPTSQAGDVVFKTHYSGDRHGMIFNMNDAFNDGNSYIKFNDNLNHNTLTILNNGRVGIGTADPQAELDVKGDVLVVDGSVGLGTQQPKARLHIAQGDVFIEDIEYGIIMKSPNGQCWRGTLTDQGMLNFVLTDCPDLVSIPQVVQQTTRLQVFPNPAKNSISIQTSPENRSGRLLLMATDGTEVRSTTITVDITELSLEGLPAGTYIIRLEHNGSVVESVKVVKQ
jgi:hypothetical protein